jgi:ankyrin repeat protein
VLIILPFLTLIQQGLLPLHIAVEKNFQNVVSLLLLPSSSNSQIDPQLFASAEASVNAVDKKRRTPVHFCTRIEQKEIISLLFSRGCLPTAMDADGMLF